MKLRNKMKQISKKNKLAWLRIVEVMIAILIITGSLLLIYSNQNRNNAEISEDEVYRIQSQILDVISKNETLRLKIIGGDTIMINERIKKMIPNTWNFTTNICNINEICNTNTPNDKNIYSTEVLVTSTLNEYSPKKLRFFVWIE